jgi:hypothetical protein
MKIRFFLERIESDNFLNWQMKRLSVNPVSKFSHKINTQTIKNQ